jgi:hypothetical protein
MPVVLKNDAYGYLSSAITDSATSIALTTGTGANFPSLGATDYFYATIYQTSGVSEIVKVTARAGDTLTVVRAQEGTNALAFPAASRVELRVTAQSILDAIAGGGGGGGSGTVTSVNVLGGTTGLTTSGGPVTTSGSITLGGVLGTANGGTGQTSFSSGQLLIGNASGGLTKSTLTAGSGITVTNGDGVITVASAGGAGTGDVVGPASANDNGIVRFDGTGGKVIQNSAVYIDDSNRVIVGNPTSATLTATTAPQMQVHGTNTATSSYMAARYAADATMPYVFTAKSRNATAGSHTILQDNDGLGGIAMFGSDGTTFVRGAEIYAEVDGTPSSGSIPAALVFRVNGTVEKFRIWSSGLLTDDKGNLRAIPQSGVAKTGSYTLATTDVGRYILLNSGGSVVIPDSVFQTGDEVTVFNDTSGSITITCNITTAYISGTNTDRSSVTLATRGRVDILFINATTCVLSGSVT